MASAQNKPAAVVRVQLVVHIAPLPASEKPDQTRQSRRARHVPPWLQLTNALTRQSENHYQKTGAPLTRAKIALSDERHPRRLPRQHQRDRLPEVSWRC